MKKLIGCMLLFSLFGCQSHEDYQKISAQEAKQKLEHNAILLDVREPDEFAASRIPGSVNLPLNEIEKSIENTVPAKDMEILVYCRSGNRSRQAAEQLLSMGYKKVYDIGGINSWPYEIEK